MSEEQMVTITAAEYNKLKADSCLLQKLDDAGVDNWEGYEDAVGDVEEESDGTESDENAV